MPVYSIGKDKPDISVQHDHSSCHHRASGCWGEPSGANSARGRVPSDYSKTSPSKTLRSIGGFIAVFIKEG